MKKSLFFLIGIAVLTIPAFLLVLSNENQENTDTKISESPQVPHSTPDPEPIELTGTPADNYSPDQRELHCGSPDAKSNEYIKEFEVPTKCTQPSSIITDSDDNVWFVQSNTGNVAKFDPLTKEFTEYENDLWNLRQEVMLWGITYTDDNEIWFTDDVNDALWKFSIHDETYSKFDFPENGFDIFPQKISVVGDDFLINDFSGNQVVLIDHKDLDKESLNYSSISIQGGLFTSQAAVDSHGNIWFVIWKFQQEAILVKVNPNTDETEQFELPNSINAPSGLAIGPKNNIWIPDAAGNSFYKIIPDDKHVIEFITTKPAVWTYGNFSGLIKTPISRPYWNAFDSDGNMWFNQQTANRLAVFNPNTESLIEYDIPSKNPNWSDCGEMKDCGNSQSLGFTLSDDKVWFTEWVENNIGVLDSSKILPISLETQKEEIQIKQGELKEIHVTIKPQTDEKLEVLLTSNTSAESIKVETPSETIEVLGTEIEIPVTIFAENNAQKGSYKVLIGTQLQDVVVSSYITIKII